MQSECPDTLLTERAYGDLHRCRVQPPSGRKVWLMAGRSSPPCVIRHGSSGDRGLTTRQPLYGDITLCRATYALCCRDGTPSTACQTTREHRQLVEFIIGDHTAIKEKESSQ